MAPKFKFTEGEKVLCFHGPLLYEAKCIKAQVKDKVVKYYIHYSGWNKNWDEWVPESRVLKYNDANMQRQKELTASHGNNKKTKAVKTGAKKEFSDRESSILPPQEKTPKQVKKEGTPKTNVTANAKTAGAAKANVTGNAKTTGTPKISSTGNTKTTGTPKTSLTSTAKITAAPAPSSTTESSTEQQRKKRTRAEQNVETEEEFTQKLEVKIRMPEELKHWLKDDWNLVTNKKMLYKLPARVTVEDIIADYTKIKMSVKGMTPNKETAVLEITAGIREYFNVMLKPQLLYKSERAQHVEIISRNPDTLPSKIYGSFHLLRLFTKIGGALAYTSLDEDSTSLLTNHLFEFLKHLTKSSYLFNLSDYECASQEQVKKEKS